MEVEIKDSEVIEVYTTGKSSQRVLPIGLAERVVMRLMQFKCAHTESDMIKCKVQDFDGNSVRLKDNWRLEVENNKYWFSVGKIFEVKKI